MSKIEVNTVEPQCGTTLTLGGCGQTVALGSGASQTGFGRTGTVDWQTGDIKTSEFTAATGKGYFVNTTSGTVTVNFLEIINIILLQHQELLPYVQQEQEVCCKPMYLIW
jgi:hypothetical protein